MNAADYARLRQLFDAAAELPAADRRAAVKALGSGEPELCALVDSLLAHLDDSATEAAAFHAIEEVTRSHFMASEGRRMGPYVLLQRLGGGGQGEVYLAERVDGYRQQVAVKVLRTATADETTVRRFDVEKQALALLRHPGIAAILDGGCTPDGQPYLVMEYVSGPTLKHRLAEAPLPPRKAAEVVFAVTQAVAHAHAHDVLHRDLKPHNVMLPDEEEPGTVKVTDFGLAKVVGSGDSLTCTGIPMGTPSYMSPEQADGRWGQVGPGTDVWALGAILYECISARPPFHGASDLETFRMIKENEVVALRELQPGVPRDLETICHHCLQKDPSRRYPSAEALSDDLRRYLEGHPITAVPPSAWSVAGKFVRRNRALVGGVAAILAALVLGLSAVLLALAQEKTQRLRAEAAERRNGELLTEALAREARLHMQRGEWSGALTVLDPAIARLEESGAEGVLDLRFERAKVLFALNDPRAHGDLEGLLATAHDRPRLRAEMLLWKGDLRPGGMSLASSRALIREALVSRHLDDVDSSFAHGLLATTADEAIEAFTSVRERRPYHQRANYLLAMTLFLCGRMDELGLHLSRARAFFPTDRNLLIVEALLSACRGNEATMRSILIRLDQQLSADDRMMLQLCAQMFLDLRDLDKLAGMSPFEFSTRVINRLGPALQLRQRQGASGDKPANSYPWRIATPLQEEVFAPFVAALFPDAAGASPNVFQLVARLNAIRLDPKKTMSLIEPVLKVFPEGTLFCLRGNCRQMLANQLVFAGPARSSSTAEWRQTVRNALQPCIEDLEKALNTPSIVDFRREAHFSLAALQSLLWIKSGRQDRAAAQKSIEHYRFLLYNGGLSRLGGGASNHLKLILELGAPELALSVAADWMRTAPDDAATVLLMAETEHLTGSHGNAIQRCERLRPLVNGTQLKEVDALVARCRERLRAAKEVSDSPPPSAPKSK